MQGYIFTQNEVNLFIIFFPYFFFFENFIMRKTPPLDIPFGCGMLIFFTRIYNMICHGKWSCLCHKFSHCNHYVNNGIFVNNNNTFCNFPETKLSGDFVIFFVAFLSKICTSLVSWLISLCFSTEFLELPSLRNIVNQNISGIGMILPLLYPWFV